MKSKALIGGAFGALLCLAAGPAAADAGFDFAKTKGCTACHDVTKKVIGPPYAEVAKKYKGQADAQDKLVGSILKGSSGKWGAIPMPPNKVTDEDAKKLAAWVLSL